MIKADKATVLWDTDKKIWRVRIEVGEEVIKRPAGKLGRDAEETALRTAAVETARADGYEVDPATITVSR